MIRLQRFGHRVSGYDRPNEPWICGWAAIGEPCRVGPDRRGRCQAMFECQPLRKGDRWECTRPATAGGRCTAGPSPNGTCSRAIPRCVPLRSQRSQRGRIAAATFAALVGLLVVVLGGTDAAWLISPGPLSVRHGGIRQCSACHTRFAAGPIGWLHAAFAAAPIPAMAQPCLVCHHLGRHPLSAHGLDEPMLTKLGRDIVAEAAVSGDGGAAKAAALTPAAFTLPPLARAAVACSACHREHRGSDTRLTAVHSAVCQTCHVVRFRSLAHGHPDFIDFPFHRRMRIIFDHARHFGQYFGQSNKALVPSGCAGCHVVSQSGTAMLLKPFATACAGCHLGDIKEREGAEFQGVAVLGVPALDVRTLEAHHAAIGDWPEQADGDLTPFLRFLLARQPGTAKDLAILGTTSLADLSHADAAQIAAAARIAWAIKGLLFDLSVKGPAILADAVPQKNRAAGESAALIGGLPPDAIRMAAKLWFPDLADEVARHRAGEPVPMKAPKPPPKASGATPPQPPATQGPIAGISHGSILGGGGLLGAAPAAPPKESHAAILGGGGLLGAAPAAPPKESHAAILGGGGLLGAAPAPPIAAAAPPAPQKPQPVAPIGSEAWTKLGGGWYRQDYFLYYRPAGHADPFLRAWLAVTGREAGERNGLARQLFERLSNPSAPGACGECHSVDRGPDGSRIVNWFPFRPDPAEHGFTKFAHRPHLTLVGSEGCKTCHRFNTTANFAATYKNGNPFVFAASFEPIKKRLCASCHVAGHASAACTTCHNYHIGDIPNAMGAMTMRPAHRAPSGSAQPHRLGAFLQFPRATGRAGASRLADELWP
jgi:hypothetical protein